MELNTLQMLESYRPQNTLKAPRSGDQHGLKEACKEFETILLEQMLKSMRKTVQKSGLMQGGMAEDIFEDMLYEKYARKMSDSANLGLADMLYRQLSQKHTLPG
jgi:flagellar protein FlgJ